MPLKSFVDVLARRRGGIFVLSGIAALLTGVERVLRSPGASARTGKHGETSSGNFARQRKNFFSIRQTRSELGYVYWVLQGYGEFSSFELFDTWVEAMTAADARLAHSEAYSLGLRRTSAYCF
jgi:hypothetical protein